MNGAPPDTLLGLERLLTQARSEHGGGAAISAKLPCHGEAEEWTKLPDVPTTPVDYFKIPIDDDRHCAVVVTYATADALVARPRTVASLSKVAPRMGSENQVQFHRTWLLQYHLELILKALSEPAFLCDEGLSVVNANPPGRRYFEQRFGHALEDGPSPSLETLGGGALLDGIAKLKAERIQTLSVSFVDEDGTFVLADLIRHLPPGLTGQSDQFAEQARDPASFLVVKLRITRRVVANVPAEVMRVLGITPAEARLLEGLLVGRTLHEIADANGTSYNTVRNQFASILQKTNLRTQADVIRFFTYLS